MENCKKHSKLLCSQCRYFDQCDIAKRCDGVCYKCDIADCENNPIYKEKKNDERNQDRNRLVGFV